MRVLLYFVTCFILFINFNEAARILVVIPTPSISHQVVFRPVVQELAKRGHDVTIITTDPAFPKGGTPGNLTEIDVHDISYRVWREHFMKASKTDGGDLYNQLNTIVTVGLRVFVEQFNDANVQRLIKDKNQKFDLIITEALSRTALGYQHIYKAPLILMSSFGATFDNFEALGLPTHPLLYPTIIRQRINDLTMMEKISEVYTSFRLYNMFSNFLVEEEKTMKKLYGPDVPSVNEFYNRIEMLFLNENPVFTGIRPVPPNVIYMGGLHQNPLKELPKDLKLYLDSSKNGVIYISFGTNVDPTQLPADRIQALVEAVSQLPYDVLWKWNGDELPGRTENIRISKWLPQSDLLRHPKIKVFVTQGGLQSTDEAITAGVPLIGIPLLADQWFNVERYVTHGIGVRLDIATLTAESFKNTLLKVIEDDSYPQNTVKLRTLMRDQPLTPLERTIWWIEHVLRHGGAKHLRSPAANISWAEYLELELVLTLLAGLLAAISVVVLSIYWLFKYFVGYNVLNSKVKRS
ncbi:UDP-glucuronosyltransferase 2B15-like isoform X4 [Trichoplusia ni]|uniref:UDP-glucuronosyltransferase n=1 Tax=Trichoplusia ni TaxID=7111 RepID=A0A7E5W5V3_TRINI|nr:UDP-glucuronosyltransferase 2B15-like isoform X4 [Trichoplusia ni]